MLRYEEMNFDSETLPPSILFSPMFTITFSLDVVNPFSNTVSYSCSSSTFKTGITIDYEAYRQSGLKTQINYNHRSEQTPYLPYEHYLHFLI